MQDITEGVRVKTRRKDCMDLRYFTKIPQVRLRYREGTENHYMLGVDDRDVVGTEPMGFHYFRGADLLSMTTKRYGNTEITNLTTAVGNNGQALITTLLTPEQVCEAVGEAEAFVLSEIEQERAAEAEQIKKAVTRAIAQIQERNTDVVISGDN